MAAPPLAAMMVPVPVTDKDAPAREPSGLLALSDDFSGACTSRTFMSIEELDVSSTEVTDALLVSELTATCFGDEVGLDDSDLVAFLEEDGLADEAMPAFPPYKKPRTLVPPSVLPLIPSLDEETSIQTNQGKPVPVVPLCLAPPPGGPGALLNVFDLDPVKILQRRGGLTAKEYRRSKAIPKYLKKRSSRSWDKAKAPMYESRTSAASSRKRCGGKFTSAPSGWKSAVELWPSSSSSSSTK